MVALDTLLPGSLLEAPDRARSLDEAGLDGLFTYEGQSDPFFPLVRAADATTGMLYTNVAIALPRSPMHLAYQAWDLQRLTGGRFALGLGTQIRAHIVHRYGGVWERPMAQMSETIDALRAIFDSWQHGTPLAFEGRWTRHTLMPPLLTPPPLDGSPPPIWCAALGPKMTAMAGERADGLLVHPFTSRRYLEQHTVPNVELGLGRAGRNAADLTRVIGAIVGVHADDGHGREATLAAVRAMLGFYGSTPAYRPVLDAEGWGDLQPSLRALTKQGRWSELPDLVTDEQVATLAVVGSPTEVARELASRFGDIADRLALSLPGQADVDLVAELVRCYRENGASAN